MNNQKAVARKVIDYIEKNMEKEIAYEAGYDSQQSFSYAFKQIYIYPPKMYRNMGIFMPKQDRISMDYSNKKKYNKILTIIKEIAA